MGIGLPFIPSLILNTDHGHHMRIVSIWEGSTNVSVFVCAKIIGKFAFMGCANPYPAGVNKQLEVMQIIAFYSCSCELNSNFQGFCMELRFCP